ncbi:MAG: large subunit ribosomal protein L23 [Parcubacteria group bacterium Licking1014_17]|nr:MAG: large subunit ribosomal protein L23 [Parcubacteria group bacterium Licking1014_17]
MAFWNKKDDKKKKPEHRSNAAEKTVQPAADENKKEETKVLLPEGGNAESFNVIMRPLITEKASLLSETGKYVFVVSDKAGKHAIRRSVESLYKVKVEKVNVIRIPSKTRRVGRQTGVKSGYKKAVVTLKKGERIDIISH